jgi:hypothetical protein
MGDCERRSAFFWVFRTPMPLAAAGRALWLVEQWAARSGNSRWRRVTELRAGAAKSVFHFDVQGAVAKSSHVRPPLASLSPPAGSAEGAFLAVRRLGPAAGTLRRRLGSSGLSHHPSRPVAQGVTGYGCDRRRDGARLALDGGNPRGSRRDPRAAACCQLGLPFRNPWSALREENYGSTAMDTLPAVTKASCCHERAIARIVIAAAGMGRRPKSQGGRWNAGDAELATIFAAQLIVLMPEVILAVSTTNLTLIRQVTSTVPVV